MAEFPPHVRSKDGYRWKCKVCTRVFYRNYYANEGSDQCEKRKEYLRQYRQGIKDKVFAHFGAKCACCGEQEYQFLTLDHVNNDGADHRRQLSGRGAGTDSVYRELVKTEFAEADRFQILCYNCNCAKRARADFVCPHQVPTVL